MTNRNILKSSMDDKGSIKSYIRLLCTAVSTENEVEALRLLSIHLINATTTQCDPDMIEREFLSQSKTVLEEGNPFPLFEVSEITMNNDYCQLYE